MPKKFTDAYRVTKAAHASNEARSEHQKRQILDALNQTASNFQGVRVLLEEGEMIETACSEVLDLHHILGETLTKMTAVIEEARRPVHFFDMPGEVRNLIYENMLDLYKPSSDFIACMLRYENVRCSRSGERHLATSSIKCRHDAHNVHWPRGGCWVAKGGKSLPRVWLLISKRCSAEIETFFHSKGIEIGVVLADPLRWVGRMELMPPVTKLKNIDVNIRLHTRFLASHGSMSVAEGPICVINVLSVLLGRMVNVKCMNVKIFVHDMSELEEFRKAYCSDTLLLKADKLRYLCPMFAALKCEISMEIFVYARSAHQTIRFEM
jgi:hypothetical protein